MAGATILAVLCLLGSLQALLLAAAVASLRSGLRRANRLLGGMLVGAAVVILVILTSHRSIGESRGELEVLEYSLWFLAGPVFYLYIRRALSRDREPSRRFALHFLPAAAWVTYGVAWLIRNEPPWTLWRPTAVSMMLYQLAYTVLGIYAWWRSEGSRRDPLPAPHDFGVPASIGAIALLHAAQWLRWLFRDQPALVDIVPLTAAATFVTLTFVGLRRALPLLGRERQRYAGSSLSGERAGDIANRLVALMERERSFLRQDLTLDEVASDLSVPKTHLSQVVNERFEQTFLEFVAEYRVRESERQLLDESTEHLTIEALANRSGFRSRSAFYEAFRRHHGMTPSEFRKRGTHPIG